MSLILVANPDQHLLEGMRDILELDGFDVLIANDGDLALQLVREHHPDLIVSEMGFRGFKGVDLLKAVRADSNIASIPFIFSTVQGETIDVRKAMFLGIDEVIIAPYDPNDLLITVSAHLHKSDIIKSLPKTEKDNDIFVNYVSTDAALVQQGIDHLRRAELSLILAADKKDWIRDGDKEAIALVRRSRCIVTFFSTEYNMGYNRKFATQFEMRIAYLIGIPIFLVHINGDEKAIPTDFKRFYKADVRENTDEAINQLINRIKKYIDYINAL